MGRLDHLAAVGGGGLGGRVDVLDRDVRDPVRRLTVALRRRVAADHRVGRLAGTDHLVGGVAHREGHRLPPEHLAIERLHPLGVAGHELEPHELSGEQLTIGHDVSPFTLESNDTGRKRHPRPNVIPTPGARAHGVLGSTSCHPG